MFIREVLGQICTFFSVAEVDKDVIIAILVKRNNEQRQKIKVLYENMAGKVCKKKLFYQSCQRVVNVNDNCCCSAPQRLDKDLKSCLRSDLEDVSLALLMSPAHFDAYQLRKATKVQGGSFHAILTSTILINHFFQSQLQAFSEDS